MPRDVLRVWIQLDRIVCHEEGDGWGSAEPYLWPVFFKVDGETVTLDGATLMLSGTATVEGRFGNHGNLGNTDVDAGEELPVPEALGSWQTILKPIPIIPSVDMPGIAGVVAILMEHDNVTDAAAVAGYQALVTAIRTGLDALIPQLGLSNQTPTPDDIRAIQTAAETAVREAIQRQQNFFENIWAALNPDDQIGTIVAQFGHDTLAGGAVQQINARWENQGIWELFGHASASLLCPADSLVILAPILGDIFGEGEMEMMRGFRDDSMPEGRGARDWWGLAERNAAALMWLVQTDRDALAALSSFGPAAAKLLATPDAVIPEELVLNLRSLLDRASQSPSRQLRSDAKRALSMLDLARGRTVPQMLDVAEALRPGRKIDQAALGRLEQQFRPQADPPG